MRTIFLAIVALFLMMTTQAVQLQADVEAGNWNTAQKMADAQSKIQDILRKIRERTNKNYPNWRANLDVMGERVKRELEAGKRNKQDRLAGRGARY